MRSLSPQKHFVPTICSVLLAHAALASPNFYDLGTIEGPSGESQARAVSADGATVVGESSSLAQGHSEAFR